MLADRTPLDAGTVEAMFEEINLLVLEGDAAGLATKVSELSTVRAAPQTALTGAAEPAEVSPPPGPSAGDAQAPAPLIHSQSS